MPYGVWCYLCRYCYRVFCHFFFSRATEGRSIFSNTTVSVKWTHSDLPWVVQGISSHFSTRDQKVGLIMWLFELSKKIPILPHTQPSHSSMFLRLSVSERSGMRSSLTFLSLVSQTRSSVSRHRVRPRLLSVYRGSSSTSIISISQEQQSSSRRFLRRSYERGKSRSHSEIPDDLTMALRRHLLSRGRSHRSRKTFPAWGLRSQNP